MGGNKRTAKDFSPESLNNTINPKAEKSLKMDVNQMKELLSSFKEEMTLEIKESEKRLGEKLDLSVRAIAQRVTTLESENVALKEENRVLTDKIARIEEGNRRNNIVISGIKATNHDEALQCVREMIGANVKRPVDIGNVRLIKQKTGGPKVVVSCKFFEDKLVILSHKKDFRSREGCAVFINDDLTKDQSRLQFELRVHAKTLREMGRTVKTRRGQIQVDNGPWTDYKPETNPPEDTKVAKI